MLLVASFLVTIATGPPKTCALMISEQLLQTVFADNKCS